MTARAPGSIAEIQSLVQNSDRVHVVGKGSKTALHNQTDGAAIVDLSGMSGILEYQPSEYTVTVGAGGLVRDLEAALKQHGQYLPCDPLLPGAASIGGTVACNLAGPRRFRYGGVRDFILGAQLVDGMGRAFRVGGKVVKNAAGFDLSKFLVGSLGRYAIMTELTFKVFPDAPCFRSLRFNYERLDDALSAIFFINQSAYELDALDLIPAADGWSLLARLAGFQESLPQRVERFAAGMERDTAPSDIATLAESPNLWDPLAELSGEFLVKAALAPKQIPAFDRMIAGARRRYGVGGNIAWLATDDVEALAAALRNCGLRGLCLRGAVHSAVIGAPADDALAQRVKQVLDPEHKLV
ncbi:MAG: FAD-binding protein [Chloroflexota bacterium]|nr:FAD-binding protein [Chloroflexota bacterium]MDE2947708.1 FAD-binding protein [Chloroflexota bacterium]